MSKARKFQPVRMPLSRLTKGSLFCHLNRGADGKLYASPNLYLVVREMDCTGRIGVVSCVSYTQRQFSNDMQWMSGVDRLVEVVEQWEDKPTPKRKSKV